MKEKYFKKLFLIIFISGFIVFFVYVQFKIKLDKRNFYNNNYSGVIIKIFKYEGNFGCYDIKLTNKLINLGVYDSYIQKYIQVGDSIEKRPQTNMVKLYRKNEIGQWVEIEVNKNK